MDNEIQTSLTDFFRQIPSNFSHVIESVVIIIVLILVHIIIKRIVRRQTDDEAIRYKWRKNLAYILSFFGFIIIGRIWFEGVGSLATFLGLLSAGLAIALRDPVTDMAGWVFLIWRKPFQVGDRIQIGDTKGDVIDIRFFKFSLLEIGNWVSADQSTGRVIHMPNHFILRESIFNSTSDFDFLWNEIPIVVTFESDWKRAKEILTDIVQNHMEDYVLDAEEQVRRATKSYLIRYKNLTPIVYTEVVDIGVKLTIRHLSHARKRRGINQTIWEDILDRFDQEDSIDFAYSTLRIYQNQIEGKSGLMPDS
ncbi:mechanosensitive ion channel family protein [Rhodohalobacter barkolensis]|uniref:Mechanosensitive ion channel protein MscS n=1 Tax=Rhodohalobacter barkolensis TaxID=2053187 RepID=A0A2N0VEE3_9BACT|nr:mechanosensitive ion channel domain-containing protein [Rhodohalobacter barkolensis]PKD42553.1 mechanosensitive ion channel protein MscS [Rhodohalobacter barkolensis]